MIIYKGNKKKEKLVKAHTIYIKMEDGTKIRISEESKNSLSIFAMNEKEFLATVPAGPRTFILRTFKDWFY
jgi:hypothetical protein